MDEPNESEDGPEKSPKSSQPRREVRLLDYACGTGMMTRVSSPLCKIPFVVSSGTPTLLSVLENDA